MVDDVVGVEGDEIPVPDLEGKKLPRRRLPSPVVYAVVG